MRSLNAFLRERKWFLGGLGLAIALIGMLLATLGHERTWRLWSIPAWDRPFLDVHVITDGAKSFREGLDPMVENPGDVQKRLLNYPRLWQGLYLLGVDEHDTQAVGFVIVGAWLLAVVLVIPPLSPGRALLMLAAVFSPALLLGVERGNTDLLMFALLAFAWRLAAARPRLALVLVTLAFALKLYPLLGLVLFWGDGRPAVRRGMVAALGFVGLYLLFSLGDLALIRGSTPQGTWMSYGLDLLRLGLEPARPELARGVKFASWLVAFAWAAWAWWRRKPASTGWDDDALLGFRLGAACFVGTYLVGTSFVYRLVLVLPALPQLFLWSGAAVAGLRRPARLTLVAIYLALWSLALERWLKAMGVGETAMLAGIALVHGLVFGGLVWLAARAWPATGDKAGEADPAT